MKIVFTSCMNAEKVAVQPIWERIVQDRPNALVLLGDSIYMDWGLSLANTPKWKRRIEREPENGLAEYAKEMYARYKLQADLPSFYEPLRQMPGVPIYLTWDDHDFAWNNALGGDDGDKGVPTAVTAVSRTLAKQFATHINTNPGERYPEMPTKATFASNAETDNTEPLFPEQSGQVGGVDFMMTDQRGYRTHRDSARPSLMGPAQGERFRAMLNQAGHGLLIVAGGSPIAHKYRFSDQGWMGPSSYEEVDWLKEAKRPVLYLGGDIHKNLWGGQVPNTRVVQAVSSGAAISSIFFVRNEPSYGLLTVESQDGLTGSVRIDYRKMKDRETWESQDGTGQAITFGPDDWTSNIPAGSIKALGQLAQGSLDDTRPLSIIALRRPDDDYEDALPTLHPIEQLDDLHRSAVPKSNRPDLVTLAPADSGNVLINEVAHQTDFENIKPFIRERFEYAQANGLKSVALFIHGFNKTFASAADQAYAIRERFPQCEPILFSWPSGEDASDGFLKAWIEYSKVSRTIAAVIGSDGEEDGGEVSDENVSEAASPIAQVLSSFNDVCNEFSDQSLNGIVIARSMGAKLLQETARQFSGTDLTSVHRVILSAPAVHPGMLHEWVDSLQTEVVVTVNRHDKVLDHDSQANDWSGWLDEVPLNKPGSRTQFLDCTNVPAMKDRHDYLFAYLHDDLDNAMRVAIYGAQVSPSNMSGFHRTVNAGAPIWQYGP